MLSFYLIITLTTFCFALTTVENTPTVHLDKAKFLGTNDHGVVRFLGIPYALPPYVLQSHSVQLAELPNIV
jgi:ABC-type nitrate/sulfonate/bicarbonate transport system permease component